MNILDYIMFNNDPSKPYMEVDYANVLPAFIETYNRVYSGEVKFIAFPPGFDDKYVAESVKYRMAGVADLTKIAMKTIYDIDLIYDEMKFVRHRPIQIETGQTWIIHGQQRSGKSSLALWLAYSIYQDWDVAIAHLIIDPFQLREMIKTLDALKIRRVPAIIIDDAGIGFGKSVARFDRERLEVLGKLAQVWSSVFSNVILTVPDKDRISSPVMKSLPVSLEVKVSPLGDTENVSLAKVYTRMVWGKKEYTPMYKVRDFTNTRVGIMAKRKLEEMANTVYVPRLIPNEAFLKYSEIRRKYLTLSAL